MSYRPQSSYEPYTVMSEKEYSRSQKTTTRIVTRDEKSKSLERRRLKKKLNNPVRKPTSQSKKAGIYSPHFGQEMHPMLSLFKSELHEISQQPLMRVYHVFESVMLLFKVLSEVQTSDAAQCAILSFVKNFTSGPISMTLAHLITDTLLLIVTPQSSMETCMDIFRTAVKSWKQAATSPVFHHVSKVLNVSLALGLCKSAGIRATADILNAFSHCMIPKQTTAVDFIDACVSAANYFVEAGYEAFRTNSLRPFLFTDQSARRLDDNYYFLQLAMKQLPTGNLDLIKHADGSIVTEDTLNDLLEKTLSELENCVNACDRNDSSWQAKLFRDRLNQVKIWKVDLLQCIMGGGLREAPFSMFFFGDSGIGKSAIVNNLMQVALQSNGFPSDPQRVVTMNANDKFWSNFRSDTTGVILDDVANTHPSFTTEPPTRMVIDLVNNVAGYAPKSESNEKGKVAIRLKVLCASSNIKGFNSHVYSVKPVSVCRRGFNITVKLREEFSQNKRFSRDKILRKFGSIPTYPDIYDFYVEIADENEHSGVVYKPHTYIDNHGKRIVLTKVSYLDMVKWVTLESRKHFDDQRQFLDSLKNVSSITFCPFCKMVDACCICPAIIRDGCPKADDDDSECDDMTDEEATVFMDKCRKAKNKFKEQNGVETMLWVRTQIYRLAGPRWGTYFDATCGDIADWFYARHTYRNILMQTQAHDSLRTSFWSLWLFLVPDNIYGLPIIRDFFLTNVTEESTIYTIFTLYTVVWFSICLATIMTLWLGKLYILFPLIPILFLSGAMVQRTRIFLEQKIHRERTAMQQAMRRFRDPIVHHGTQAAQFLALLTGFIAVYKMYKKCSNVFSVHSALDPVDNQEEKLRDVQVNAWAKPPIVKSSTEAVKTITHDDLSRLVFKNLAYMRKLGSASVTFCNAFFVKTGIAIIPTHMLDKDECVYEFYRNSPDIPGVQFNAKLSLNTSVPIPNTDMSVVSISSSGDWRDLTKYFAWDTVTSVPFRMVWKKRDGEQTNAYGYTTRGSCYNGSVTFDGFKYDLDINTFSGLCMATLVSSTRTPQIIGWHVGGITGKPQGLACYITKEQFDEAVASLFDKNRCILQLAADNDIPKEQMGKEIVLTPDIHAKSETLFIGPESNFAVYGSCEGRVEYFSSVVKTPIANDVNKAFCVTKTWGKPKFHRWRPWQASLAFSSRPCSGMSPALLNKAVDDYYNQITHMFRNRKLQVLTDIECVSGIDGLRFVDAIDPNTSMGFPINRPKREFLIDLEPDDIHNCPRTLPDWVWDEIKSCELNYLSGLRCHHIFKACLKDEPTDVTKDKVRVFQAAPVQLGLMVRKYFLPIVRVLSLYPLRSECAVGINAYSKEWDELHRHITKYGDNFILAGDFSKYDLTMPAEVTIAAFRILIDIAAECGYSDDQLMIMRGLATDIVYPLVAFNGTMLKLFGGNPSGQNLTVYINSIANSLLCRYGLFSVFPKTTSPFNQCVSMTTYGDDFKGSVAPKFRAFNHITYRDVLAQFGMKITMPNKKDEATPFMNDYDCDFLKRKSRWMPELQSYVGALEQESCIKSLVSVVRSKYLTLQEQCAVNISGALNEAFYHGRHVYDEWQSKLIEIAENHAIAHMIPNLRKSFDDRVAQWKEQYDPS